MRVYKPKEKKQPLTDFNSITARHKTLKSEGFRWQQKNIQKLVLLIRMDVGLLVRKKEPNNLLMRIAPVLASARPHTLRNKEYS